MMKPKLSAIRTYALALLLVAPLYTFAWWLMFLHVPRLSAAYDAAGIDMFPAFVQFAVFSWCDLHYRPWLPILIVAGLALFEWRTVSSWKPVIRNATVYALVLVITLYLTAITFFVTFGTHVYEFKRHLLVTVDGEQPAEELSAAAARQSKP